MVKIKKKRFIVVIEGGYGDTFETEEALCEWIENELNELCVDDLIIYEAMAGGYLQELEIQTGVRVHRA